MESKTKGYYRLVVGSKGLTFGEEQVGIIIVFMTDEALRGFQKAKDWEIGIDASVVLIYIGVWQHLNSATLKYPILGFVLMRMASSWIPL